MNNATLPMVPEEPALGLRQQLDRTQAKLLRYARDMDAMRRLLDEREAQLAKNQLELATYARQLEDTREVAEQRDRELESAQRDTVWRLMQAAKFRDSETGIHLRRISRLCGEMARHLGWSESEIHLLQKASALHDIGKIGISDSILRKRGPLDDDEWRVMQRHTVIGAKLLEGSTSKLLQWAREIALSHHERWDGSGYPNGLEAHEIPMRARLVTICDHYEALRSVRPYKPAYDHETVCEILLRGDGKTRPQHFDPDLLELFTHIHERFETLWDELMLDGTEPARDILQG